MVLTSEKNIKFADLAKFKSIEDAKESIIEREIESIIRQSHHEQFSLMESKFSIKLKQDLKIWPDFIELCERRNLLTHTGGIVSSQYLANCLDLCGKDFDAKIGQRLKIDSAYYSNAVNVIYEMGAKLCHVFWRKFAKDERDEADAALVQFGYDLIYNRVYVLAESVLNFGTKTLKQHSSDKHRRMMIINLANAVRLQDRQADAIVIVDSEDWSASSDDFKICAHAVKDDIESVVSLMRQIGKTGNITMEDYRTWPIFRRLRDKESFLLAFEHIFGEPLTIKRRIATPLDETPTQAAVEVQKLTAAKRSKLQ